MYHFLISSCIVILTLVNSLTVTANADFQVTNPPAVPQDAKQCTVNLLTRSFGNSFGDPEVVQYTPPTNCGTPGSWAAITLNWTAASIGNNFDRLATITFHNVEIWRTSTPEPTATGVTWTYIKDVTRYVPLFATPGILILELDNIINPNQGLTGAYNVSVEATFFESSSAHPAAPKANVIIPISNLSPNSSNVVSVPPAFSLDVTFPTNTIEAYAELYASGNSNEEAWYTNMPNEFIATPDNGPFREIQLLIDGMLAGVAFPYPAIFSGTLIPQTWGSILPYGALDLPTYFIDLTPFAPLLSNGKPHNITLNVVSAEANHTINQNWFVSGNIQVVTDSSNKPTTGKILSYDVSPFAVSSTNGTLSPNGDASVMVNATRFLRIEGQVRSGSGKVTNAVWQQELNYTNLQLYSQNNTILIYEQASSGCSYSTHNGTIVVKEVFNFPLVLNDIQGTNASFISFDHSYDRQINPSPFIIGSTINSHQLASAGSLDATDPIFSNNTFSYADVQGNTFTRNVTFINSTIVFDMESGSLL